MQHILNQSSLIDVLKNVRVNFEKMLALDHRTFKHSPPKMLKTFNKLADYIQKHATHLYTPGRKAQYVIPDAYTEGMAMTFTTSKHDRLENEADATTDQEIEADGDDGDLDV
ncbi:hypothetical protein GLOTRDRAFT_134656 [Gloeophyllum trabeum ATCC 11539]|uniref:Uncharacterized protein n=1 Tax=Gloeophyllum trabeum (strain ATCC 11539 / FP-39264 / Madison 617) TaxID=670483 RepID=S7PQV8_GLOTA|nr:uncharacterized protein GLOTRDRAFT_134656 [Gloeophyllum trabeum ATCC 11539]EPQ49752.1 hypothetical protein GLOTRDRAFT_134656 [Gloeophyllum trabeum ATCC 11539]